MTGEASQDRENDLERAASEIRELLESARRRIWLQTRSQLLCALPPIDFAGALSRIARCTRYADLRLLIDDALALKEGQPQLARAVMRLTSAVDVRCFQPDEDTPASLLLIVDQGGWLYLVQHKGHVGLKSYRDDPPGALLAAERFAEVWDFSTEALELRNLTI
ncbi:hypothetical protein TVNIR_2711 [Thioalkalivibrio nitratireducens DSM 14787]|uniref:DUF7931 domain-containing protein n=1 Tax=Thioalkalivibrio nitratireducens (strain DSM 14787 / UNIQEM 213 / ALEN2) TaxID=1255043 RepID=L0DXP0_THIND|nr:hypothetical protein [Thioalkalivibrio nitratireducens]AGA34349.1 hypothetical protein TVNIR_2711 [Thioalkalivibrio nitratireducens DSM 14787]